MPAGSALVFAQLTGEPPCERTSATTSSIGGGPVLAGSLVPLRDRLELVECHFSGSPNILCLQGNADQLGGHIRQMRHRVVKVTTPFGGECSTPLSADGSGSLDKIGDDQSHAVCIEWRDNGASWLPV